MDVLSLVLWTTQSGESFEGVAAYLPSRNGSRIWNFWQGIFFIYRARGCFRVWTIFLTWSEVDEVLFRLNLFGFLSRYRVYVWRSLSVGIFRQSIQIFVKLRDDQISRHLWKLIIFALVLSSRYRCRTLVWRLGRCQALSRLCVLCRTPRWIPSRRVLLLQRKRIRHCRLHWPTCSYCRFRGLYPQSISAAILPFSHLRLRRATPRR